MRRRWRVHLALALLIGIVGAVILTVGAGAQTTASAYDRFIKRQAIPTVEMDSVPDEARGAVASIPGVKAFGTYSVAFAAPDRAGVLPGQDAVAFAPVDRAYGPPSTDRSCCPAGFPGSTPSTRSRSTSRRRPLITCDRDR